MHTASKQAKRSPKKLMLGLSDDQSLSQSIHWAIRMNALTSEGFLSSIKQTAKRNLYTTDHIVLKTIFLHFSVTRECMYSGVIIQWNRDDNHWSERTRRTTCQWSGKTNPTNVTQVRNNLQALQPTDSSFSASQPKDRRVRKEGWQRRWSGDRVWKLSLIHISEPTRRA